VCGRVSEHSGSWGGSYRSRGVRHGTALGRLQAAAVMQCSEATVQ
jgi:hypothetical protein